MMRYKLYVRGLISVNERDLVKALDAFNAWAKGLAEGDDVCLCQGGLYGVEGVELAVDMQSSHEREGRPTRSRRDRRGRSSSDGVLPIDLAPEEGA
jgi:hypothetical protein